jgi:hypothetical protein
MALGSHFPFWYSSLERSGSLAPTTHGQRGESKQTKTPDCSSALFSRALHAGDGNFIHSHVYAFPLMYETADCKSIA